MTRDTNILQDLLRRARLRRQLLLSLRGIAICLCVIAGVILLTGWLVHRYRYNGGAVIALRLGALFTCLATVYFALVHPLLRKISDSRIARLIEERSPGTDDRLVTAVEYTSAEHKISPALVSRLQADASHLSALIDLGNVIRRSRLMFYVTASLTSLLIFAAVFKYDPHVNSYAACQSVN